MAREPQFGVEKTADQLTTQDPSAVLYGVNPNNRFIPVRIDAQGRLEIGSGMSLVLDTDNVDIGDIVIKGVDPEDGNSEHRIAVDNLGAGEGFAVRASIFTGSNQLSINTDGSMDVNIVSGSMFPSETDDGSVAGGQSASLAISLSYGWNGTTWERVLASSGRLIVDGSQVTQPISAASLPLPTGAATEATLSAIDSTLDVTLSSRASEATLSGFRTDFNAVDFATETTLSGIKAKTDLLTFDLSNRVAIQDQPSFDVLLSTRASEATLSGLRTDFNAVDFATESTLSTLLLDSTFTSRINTLGQKTSAASTPVVLSSDQSAIPVTDNGGTLTVDGTVSVNNFPATQTVAIDQTGTNNDVDVVSLPADIDIRDLSSLQDSVAVLQATHDNLNSNANIQVGDVDVSNANPVPVSDGGGVITVDGSGTFITDPTDRVAREVGRVSASHTIHAEESYVTTDVDANARPVEGDFDVQHHKTKTVVLENVGANNARVNILGSVDGGVNFDIIIGNNVAVNSGNTLVTSEERAMTHIRVEARSAVAGTPTTIESRAYSLGV